MNGKALVPLVAGLGIGGFALWMGFNTLKSARGAQQPRDDVQVWAAVDNIGRGTEISEPMVKSLRFPASLVPAGAIKERSGLVGRVTDIDAPAGLPILEPMLLPPGAPPGIHVKPGLVAVALKVDESAAVGGWMRPGDFVDVYSTFVVRGPRGQDTIAKCVAENVEVAAVGPRLSTIKGKETPEESGSNRSVARAVTLFVRPNDVPKITLAEKGKVKLCLRSGEDGTIEGGEAPMASEQVLTGQVPPEPPPAPVLAAAPPPVETAPAKVEPPPPPRPAWTTVVVRNTRNKDAEREEVNYRKIDSGERLDPDAPPAPEADTDGAANPPPAGSTTETEAEKSKEHQG